MLKGEMLAPLRACAVPSCPALVRTGRCPTHARQYERQRPNADIRAWYHTSRWRRLRAIVLREQPLCVQCQAEHHVRAATEVDHITPHHGDVVLFWSRSNLQGLCSTCHARKTRSGQWTHQPRGGLFFGKWCLPNRSGASFARGWNQKAGSI